MKQIKFIFATILSIVCLMIPCRADENEILLPIIMYHEIKNTKPGKDVITPAELESDLKYLTENGYNTINMSELISYVYLNVPLPSKPVLLSFDDGHLNNYVYALPLLEKYNCKMVFSIIGKNCDDFTECPDANIEYAHVTWETLNEMLNTGLVEVQNHSYDMHKCDSRIGCRQKNGEPGVAYEKTISDDLVKLQERMYTMTGRVASTFAYPYGEYSKYSDSTLLELGFRATFSCDFGLNRISNDPDCLFNLRRLCRSHGTPAEKLLSQAAEYPLKGRK